MWQGRDGLAPHGCVGLHGAVTWGAGPRARVPSTLSQLIPIFSELTWPNPRGWGAGALLAQDSNWGREKDTQGLSWQALAPCHLLPPTSRTHFSQPGCSWPTAPTAMVVGDGQNIPTRTYRSSMSPYSGTVTSVPHRVYHLPLLLGETP